MGPGTSSNVSHMHAYIEAAAFAVAPKPMLSLRDPMRRMQRHVPDLSRNLSRQMLPGKKGSKIAEQNVVQSVLHDSAGMMYNAASQQALITCFKQRFRKEGCELLTSLQNSQS